MAENRSALFAVLVYHLSQASRAVLRGLMLARLYPRSYRYYLYVKAPANYGDPHIIGERRSMPRWRGAVTSAVEFASLPRWRGPR